MKVLVPVKRVLDANVKARRSVVEDDSGNKADAKADNTTFAGLSSSQTARWAVIYKFGTNDSDSDLIEALDLGASGINLTGLSQLTLKWDGQASNGRLFSLS